MLCCHDACFFCRRLLSVVLFDRTHGNTNNEYSMIRFLQFNVQITLDLILVFHVSGKKARRTKAVDKKARVIALHSKLVRLRTIFEKY